MYRFIRKIKRLIKFVFILLIILVFAILFLTVKYPIAYENIIVKYSEEYDIDPYLVASIINVESKYDKNAISKKEARGLMQISPQTGQWASEVLNIDNYSEEILYDPDTNIRIGAWYINTLNKEFNGKEDLILAAYNAGSGNVSKWLRQNESSTDGENLNYIPFKETRDYLNRVKLSYKIYSSIYKKQLINPTKENIFFINFLHNVRKTLKLVLRM